MRLSATIRRFQTRRPGRARSPFPEAPALRLAQISAVAPFDCGKCFPSDRWTELEAFRPNVLVGTSADLDRIVQRIQLGTLQLPSLDHAIFVITECGDQPLANSFRHLLWRNLAVPVFELFTGPKVLLIASECQAADGWHLEDRIKTSIVENELVFETPSYPKLRSGLSGAISSEACECGRPGPRILNVVPRPRVIEAQRARMRAASQQRNSLVLWAGRLTP
jgi:hypothetical protein